MINNHIAIFVPKDACFFVGMPINDASDPRRMCVRGSV